VGDTVSRDFNQSPARLSAVLGVAFGGLVVVVLAVSATTLAVVPGLVGGGMIAVGVSRCSRAAITVGTVGLLAGIVLSGVLGARPTIVLVTTITATLAWDASQNAITVGTRLGRTAETHRVEIVHIAMTAVVTTITAGSGYVIAQVSVGSLSPAALVTLLLAAVTLTAALRSQSSE
jgi:hypothetical protein